MSEQMQLEIEEETIDFTVLHLPVADFVKTLPIDEQRLVFEYLNSLDEQHRIGYNIAFTHLGSSFNVVRSVGYKQWLKSRTEPV